MSAHYRMTKVQHESLSQSVSHILEEARMVLPGIQALFGFQLIAVFNQYFQESLTEPEQLMHYAATALVAISFGLILTPAAYHRQAEPESISERFVVLSTRLLRIGLVPLIVGMAFDFYLVGLLILENPIISMFFTMIIFLLLVFLWFILPRYSKLQQLITGD